MRSRRISNLGKIIANRRKNLQDKSAEKTHKQRESTLMRNKFYRSYDCTERFLRECTHCTCLNCRITRLNDMYQVHEQVYFVLVLLFHFKTLLNAFIKEENSLLRFYTYLILRMAK